MRPNIQEKSYISISNPFKDDWRPTFRKVGDELFIQLRQFDHEFFKHCTGQPLKWGKRDNSGQHHCFPFWDELVKLRNDLSQAAFEAALVNDDDDEDEEPVMKRVKPRKARMSDAGLAGEVVRGSMTYGAHAQSIAFIFGCRGANVWMLANADTLAFVQHAMHSNFVRGDRHPEVQRRVQPRRRTGANVGPSAEEPVHDVDDDAANNIE